MTSREFYLFLTQQIMPDFTIKRCIIKKRLYDYDYDRVMMIDVDRSMFWMNPNNQTETGTDRQTERERQKSCCLTSHSYIVLRLWIQIQKFVTFFCLENKNHQRRGVLYISGTFYWFSVYMVLNILFKQ